VYQSIIRKKNTMTSLSTTMRTPEKTINTQNDLLMKNLMEFYKNRDNLHKMMYIINGESKISLRIVDWFVTNFAKKNYTVYELPVYRAGSNGQVGSVDVSGPNVQTSRFKVYNDYKLKLKAYSKKNFDPFCRWERISIPYDDQKYMETTIGQLNFFKWAIENRIVNFIETNYAIIEDDMNARNSTSKRKLSPDNNSIDLVGSDNNKTRKKREELSVSACKCIKKETVKIIVKFN
jgi:hypothetical protein